MLVATGITIGAIVAVFSTAASAAPPAHSKGANKGTSAQVEVTLDGSCDTITVVSSKDISNIVVRIDGVDTKVEFSDGVKVFDVDADGVSDVWVKSGNNKSGDGPGYGEHFAVECDDVIFDPILGWNI